MNKNKLALFLFAALLLSLGSCKKEKTEDLLPQHLQHDSHSSVINEHENCGAIIYTDEAMKARMEAMERNIQTLIAAKTNSVGSRSATTVTIPVVFHVVYNLPEQNISDAQLQSQIDVLNEDFGATNGDISTV